VVEITATMEAIVAPAAGITAMMEEGIAAPAEAGIDNPGSINIV
jgi:hypothetical protein